MLIPREDGKIRLYIELGSEEGLVDAATGRLDVSQFNVGQLLEVYTFNWCLQDIYIIVGTDCEEGLRALDPQHDTRRY